MGLRYRIHDLAIAAAVIGAGLVLLRAAHCYVSALEPSCVSSVAFSADGSQVAAAGYGLPLTILDSDSLSLLGSRRLRPPTEFVAFSDAGDRWIVNGPDARVTGLRSDHLAPEWETDLPSGSYCPVACDESSGVLLAAEAWAVAVLDPASGALLRRLSGPFGPVNAVAVSRDGSRAAVADQAGVDVVGIHDGRRIVRLDTSPPVTSLAFAPDGQSIAFCAGGSARLWYLHAREPREVRLPTGDARALAFSPKGDTLVIGGREGTLRLWHVASRRLVHSAQTDSGSIECIAFSPDGMRIASSGGRSPVVTLWDGHLHRLATQNVQTAGCPSLVGVLAGLLGVALLCGWRLRQIWTGATPGSGPVSDASR